MKKKIVQSLLVCGLLSSVNAVAAEDLSSMFSQGKTSGQIREFSVDREYQGSAGNTTHRRANAVGGHLKFETADFKGFTFGTALYTTNGFLNDTDYTNESKVDATLFGPGNGNLSFVGEAYLNYKHENTNFKAGRQTLETPMAGGDDARMIRNLFEAYMLTNTDIKGVTLTAGHIAGFSQGTFGRVYNAGADSANALLAVTGGYSYVDTKNNVGQFVNMGTYAVGKKTDGVSVASVVYTDIKNLKLQLWDYYAHDLMNVVYGQADYSWTCLLNKDVKPYVAGQFIKEDNVGDDLAGDVNGFYWAAKLGAKVENFNAYIAYSQTTENTAAEAAAGGTANAILTPWGGMSAFTQGMVTRHMYLAGTKASKIAASYNWKGFGPNLSTLAYYTSFDMHENSGYGIERTATEAGYDIIYYPEAVKNLQLRTRANFPRTFAEGTSGTTGWSEYRLIVNYNF
ncbi:outer membrane porin, OprD family [Sulfurimonas aquatica]|uniref:Outer membrane porin, OprD family n=1 Tax=Sulfurimonas aquatica TaxID=2672570 RepID=A0A975GCN6_9BACT|nr:OprD family outer membrane porin [Sulfurimonas aquatica]QSZ41469.1 outer membrane porin, OprD family [Sulfurimonas aquatica]